MKTYLISAVSVLFLSVVVSLLIPEGKLNKSVTFAMRIICILVLVQPVTDIFKISGTDSALQYFDYEYVGDAYSNHQSRQLEALLLKEFQTETECFVEIKYSGGKFVEDSVCVAVPEEKADIAEQIYAYLANLDYINITVYAQSN